MVAAEEKLIISGSNERALEQMGPKLDLDGEALLETTQHRKFLQVIKNRTVLGESNSNQFNIRISCHVSPQISLEQDVSAKDQIN